MEFTDTAKPPADGELFLRPFDRDGNTLQDPYSVFTNPDAAKRTAAGILTPSDIPEGYLPIGSNLVVDRARQVLANLAGGLEPMSDWKVAFVSWGLDDEVARFTDLTLSPQGTPANLVIPGSNQITIAGYPGNLKPILTVDFPQPYIVRWEVVLAPQEGNGYLLREMGLWTANGNLFARKTFVGTSKTSDYGLSWLWRVRF